MSLFSTVFAINAFFALIGLILYVIFGQVTVRKLRKNPETKNVLGVELASGYDIWNVAGAFSTPQWLRKRMSRSSFYHVFSANYDILYKHTTKFDRVFARVVWVFTMGPGLVMAILCIFYAFGVK